MMKVLRRLLLLVLSSSLVIFPFLKSPGRALAQTFNPSFGVTLSDSTPGNSSNLEFRVTNPAGSEIVSTFNFQIPAGWQLTAGSSFAENDQLGSGSFTAVFGGVQQTFPFVIKNKTDLQGHKLHILADFSPVPVAINVFIDGDNATGHSFVVTPPGGNDLPSELLFTLFGQSSGGVPFVVNPNVQGNYVWTANFTSVSSVNVSRSQTLLIPGTVTSVGENVAVNLSDGSAVVFASVTSSGVTTISTSTTPPPAGTGQFQLSGGLYYDYNTTAVFSCPCTITLPYDPLATPTPRIYHLESGVWTDVTTSVDTVNHTVTGVVSSFSFFAVGAADFSVAWQKKVEKLLDRKGNPFELGENDNLKIRFGLLDSAGQPKTPDNVSVEIWQTKDSAGADITPTKVLTLDPRLNEKKEYYEAKLNHKKTPLELGTYQIRIVVSNTTATQTPETAGFTLFEK